MRILTYDMPHKTRLSPPIAVSKPVISCIIVSSASPEWPTHYEDEEALTAAGKSLPSTSLHPSAALNNTLSSHRQFPRALNTVTELTHPHAIATRMRCLLHARHAAPMPRLSCH